MLQRFKRWRNERARQKCVELVYQNCLRMAAYIKRQERVSKAKVFGMWCGSMPEAKFEELIAIFVSNAWVEVEGDDLIWTGGNEL
jgi:hypothetical protein